MYKNILVALDNGPCMDLVSKEAIGHALAFGSTLILCHVKKNTVIYNSVDTMGMLTVPHMIQDHSYSMDEPLEKIKKGALAAGVKVVEIVQTHSSAPGIAIADTIAPGYEVDLIVTGRNDKSHINRLLLGSVSSNIINYASCDVLLVRNNRSEE
ncbi:MAG: universal stress protein [Turicibacter sp.]|nr:universal stress protein [Turicibacter sp.]